METSKEFAALHLTVNEVIKGLNEYFDGPSGNNVRFHSAEIDYTYDYSPKCCLAAAILWLHEQGIDYYCGMPLPCEEDKEEQEDEENDFYEHELELLDLKRKIVSALGISLSDRKLAIEDISKLHDFSYLIKLIEHQTHSYENTSILLNKANTRCTVLEGRAEKYNTLRTELINTLGVNPGITDRQLLCKVSSLYYFRREVQRKLGCRIGCSDADTMPVLLKIIDKAECFDDMDKQYMETTKSLCEIAEIIERLQSTDEKKDT
jgi:hypothetical protein